MYQPTQNLAPTQSESETKFSQQKSLVILLIVEALLIVILLAALIFILNSRPHSNPSPDQPNPVTANVLKYSYRDDSIPGGYYEVDLNYDTKKIYIKETRYCSAVNCGSKENEYTGELSSQEISKIQTIWNNLNNDDQTIDYLTSAIVDLVRGGNFAVSSDYSESEWNDENYGYAMYDVNGDGIVTNNEFGNVFLDEIITSMSKNTNNSSDSML